MQVNAEAAAALAVLADDNQACQDEVAAVGGIEPLVALLVGDDPANDEAYAADEAAAALWALTLKYAALTVAAALTAT